MTVTLNPYLNFRDTAKDAMTFYQHVFGGELTLSTFGENNMGTDPADNDKIMHGQLVTEDGLTLMAADTPMSMDVSPVTGFSVSLSGDDDERLREYWDKLTDGANIVEDLAKAPWGDSFGMLTDRFGVSWMVNIAAPK